MMDLTIGSKAQNVDLFVVNAMGELILMREM